MVETRVEFCDSERWVRQRIARMQRRGWAVASVQPVEQGYSLVKTGCLGLLFLPLALLGKKRKRWQVTFRR